MIADVLADPSCNSPSRLHCYQRTARAIWADFWCCAYCDKEIEATAGQNKKNKKNTFYHFENIDPDEFCRVITPIGLHYPQCH